MKPREHLTNGTHNRLEYQQPEAADATAREELVLDHHIEELLVAMTALADLRALRILTAARCSASPEQRWA